MYVTWPYNVAGQPSLCYHHAGDGVCEEFEKTNNIHDCGFYTPDGFVDQWASSAITDADLIGPECPTSMATGLPPVDKVFKYILNFWNYLFYH